MRKILLLNTYIFIIIMTFFICSLPAKAIETEAEQAVIMDYTTGTFLMNKAGYEMVPPSSMSKLMTLYVLFDNIKKGVYTLDDKFDVSKKAHKTGGSTMFLEAGMKVSVEDLIKGVIVLSGNDACVAIAENISGSEESFVDQMKIYAEKLGLKNSNLKNATGWPDEGHLMSVVDIAKLSKALIRDFPEFYKYFSLEEFVFKNYTGNKHNRNPLLSKVNGADGLKTGHTEIGGYGIAGSVNRDDRRLIIVLNGMAKNRRSGESSNAHKARGFRTRLNESRKLINWAFRNFDNYTFFKTGDIVTKIPLWFGKEDSLPVTVKENAIITLPKGTYVNAELTAIYETPVSAPVKAGDKVGELQITTKTIEPQKFDLVAAKTIKSTNFFFRIFENIKQIVIKLFSKSEEKEREPDE